MPRGRITPKSASASVDELEEQLAAARRIHEEDLALVERAREHFFHDGGGEAVQSVEAAESEARRSKLHVERAERLLEQAREREAREARQALEAERDRLMAELTPDAVVKRAAPIAQREAKAMLRAADVRLEREALQRELNGKVRELEGLLRQIGGRAVERSKGVWTDEQGRVRTSSQNPIHEFASAAQIATKPEIVLAALDLPPDDPRRSAVCEMLGAR